MAERSTVQNTQTRDTADLRQRAEQTLRHTVVNGQAYQDISDLIHELQVYQIELEMQNEELRQAQTQISEARDQYADLYDFAPVGYMTIGRNGGIEQANLTSATLLGVSRSTLWQLPLSHFVVAADQDLLYHHQRRIYAEPQTMHQVELRLLRAEAAPFYAQLESQAITTPQGVLAGYRTMVSDISARKQSEMALAASHQSLTNALAQLQDAQDALIQQERLSAVGQLAAGVAHDFNNILAIISNYTALLLHEPVLETSTRTRLTVIKEQIEAATNLVQQLLDFSRKSTLTCQPIDLHQFLAKLVELLGRTLPPHIRLTLYTPEEVCFISGDVNLLQQVFINLVNNALDALQAGGSVEIHLTRVDLPAQDVKLSTPVEPGAWVQIRITDSGDGMPEAVLSHIFEPFFTTKGSHGRGLGLAQVYGIIKQHGGGIEVVSLVGQGTSFMLYLPHLALVPLAADTQSTQRQPPATERRSSGKGATLLLVDDNAILLEVLAELLEMMGYAVTRLTNGAAAIEFYRQHHNTIALVITDLTMPNIGGIALTNALYQMNPAVKVMITTGYQPDDIDKAQIISNNVIWLQKPVNIDLLEHTIAQMLQMP